jgi:hypothetical protein
MGRKLGAKNKRVYQPEIIGLDDSQKLEILADILLQVIFDEAEHATTDQ